MKTYSKDTMKNLPIDIRNLILEYQGYHIFRNGKYMNRLCIHDERYSVLKQMAIAKKNDAYHNYDVSFWKKMTDQSKKTNYDMFCLIDYIIFDSYVVWRMTMAKYYNSIHKSDHTDRIQYIFY
jgi:hypothetical protein